MQKSDVGIIGFACTLVGSLDYFDRVLASLMMLAASIECGDIDTMLKECKRIVSEKGEGYETAKQMIPYLEMIQSNKSIIRVALDKKATVIKTDKSPVKVGASAFGGI